MIDKIKILGQVRQNVKKIILSYERVISTRKIDEPIPTARNAEKNRRAMERGRYGRGAFGVDEIGVSQDVNITRSPEEGHSVDREGQQVAVGLGSGAVEVEEVVIAGVVDGEEEADDPAGVAGGSGNVVGDGWGARRRGRKVAVNEDAVGMGRVVGEERGVGLAGRWSRGESEEGDD